MTKLTEFLKFLLFWFSITIFFIYRVAQKN